MTPPAPVYEEPRVALYQADCLEVMRAMPEASVDAVVTDPPYLIGFMGKEFDTQHKTFVEQTQGAPPP